MDCFDFVLYEGCGAGQVHTVTYRLARADEDVAHAAGASPGAASHEGADSSQGGGGGAGQEWAGEQSGSMAEQLQRRIGAGLGMEDPAASGEMRLTLRLLRALSILAQDWFLVAPPAPSAAGSVAWAGQDRRPLVARADFVNAKLASKLVRQLQAPRPLTSSPPRTPHPQLAAPHNALAAYFCANAPSAPAPAPSPLLSAAGLPGCRDRSWLMGRMAHERGAWVRVGVRTGGWGRIL